VQARGIPTSPRSFWASKVSGEIFRRVAQVTGFLKRLNYVIPDLIWRPSAEVFLGEIHVVDISDPESSSG
jgi:hypothetical protein